MAATLKTNTAVWASQTLTADAADTTSSEIDFTDGYSGGGGIKITNGATPPTAAAQCQVQFEQNTEWYDLFGPFVAGLDANGVYSWPLDIPIWARKVRLVAGSNTDEDVTIDADITEVEDIDA